MAYAIYDSFSEKVATVDEVDADARRRADTNDGYILDEDGEKVYDSYDAEGE